MQFYTFVFLLQTYSGCSVAGWQGPGHLNIINSCLHLHSFDIKWFWIKKRLNLTVFDSWEMGFLNSNVLSSIIPKYFTNICPLVITDVGEKLFLTEKNILTVLLQFNNQDERAIQATVFSTLSPYVAPCSDLESFLFLTEEHRRDDQVKCLLITQTSKWSSAGQLPDFYLHTLLLSDI